MMEHSLLLKLTTPGLADNNTSQLRQEYQALQKLFQVQPAMVQQQLKSQSKLISDALIHGLSRVSFTLPDQVACAPVLERPNAIEQVPVEIRSHKLGGLFPRLSHTDMSTLLCRRLSELEKSSYLAVSVSAGLLRHAVAMHMIYQVLPAGRPVVYASVSRDDIPNQPVERTRALKSDGIGQAEVLPTQAEVDETKEERSATDAEVADRFFMPQWVAFDEHGQFLLQTIEEAQAYYASMEQYLFILNLATVIAPYVIADDTWQQKRYGMVGQLVNQGRALARYQSQQLIKKMQQRVAEHRLERGCSLSLPFLDDQKLKIEYRDFMIIPAGWVMFTPAFAVMAARQEQIKVAQDIKLNFSTRKHLIKELRELELAFTR